MLIEREKINLQQLTDKYEFEYLKPPSSVYEIVIPQNQYFMDLGKGRRRRRIFYRVSYQEKQQASIREVRNKMKESGIFEKFTDEIILKQLYAAEFELPKAIERMGILQEYHNNPIISKFTPKTLSSLESGCMYTYGKDLLMRPIVVIRAGELDYNMSVQETYNFVYFLMIVVMGYMMVPYHVQKYVLIMDLQNMKLTEIPYKKIFELLTKINLYYPGNMEKTFIYNAEGLSILLNLASKFIPEHSKRKIKLIEKRKQYEVFEFINQNQLEMKYGGKLPNLTQYWPPKIPPTLKKINSEDEDSFYFSVDNNMEMFTEQETKQCQCCSIF